jgi:hypothetical protein
VCTDEGSAFKTDSRFAMFGPHVSDLMSLAFYLSEGIYEIEPEKVSKNILRGIGEGAQ